MQSTQHFCRHCNRYSLHVVSEQDFEHLPHLIMMLFCCGFWFPIWFLCWLLDDLLNPPKWRCSVCGQDPGVFTPQDIQLLHQQRVQQSGQAAAATAERREARNRRIVAAMGGLAVALRWLAAAPGRFVVWYDGVLNRMFGEEYRLLYRFAQIMTAALFALAVLGLIAWIVL